MSKYCNVIINNKSRNTDRMYTYRVPEQYKDHSLEGKRGIVSFNNSIDIGLIVSVTDTINFDEEKAKEILSIIDEESLISRQNIEIALWIRENYLSRYNEAFSLFFNPVSKVELFLKTGKDGISNFISEDNLNKWIKYNDFVKEYKKKGFGEEFEKNVSAGKIFLSSRDKSFEESFEEYIELEDLNYIEKIRKNSIKQLKILKYLEEKENAIFNDLTKEINTNRKEIDALIKKGLISVKKIYNNLNKHKAPIYSEFVLTDEQDLIVKDILSSKDKKILIHGVTGSGKTEVYMRVIESYLRVEKGIIFLVPEISLTPQTIERLRKRFGNRISVIHSRLTQNERNDEWMKIFKGYSDIVIGARSALFTPVKNLGVIIIDEAHEDSYRSSTSPKYDSIEVSERIVEKNDIKLIIGTATPSSISYFKAIKKEYKLHNITKRANDIEMPDIEIVDMRNELTEGNKSVFSRSLQNNIIETYNKKEQSILFLNRRGYSSFVSCRECGFVVKCDNCDISMTYHQKKAFMVCHYCGSAKKITRECPSCGSKYFKSFGVGTEKIEEEVRKILPEANIARMDFDTTKGKEGFNNLYENFRDKKIDVLVGTQMLAKGLHFPNVTLVGIVSADITINLPFYTSNEKSFQLITQVSGRAGRGEKKGKVVIQTYEPDNYSIVYSKNNDYISFVKRELLLRKEFRYPPYIDIVSITVSSKHEKELRIFIGDKFNLIKKELKMQLDNKKIMLYPPMNNNIYKINNKYRISIIMKYKKGISSEIKAALRKIFLNSSYKDIDISIDINPTSI